MKKGLLIFTMFMVSLAYCQEPVVITPPPSNLDENGLDPDGIAAFPDVEAEFKGGPAKLQKYMVKKFKYPSEAVEKNLQGQVFVAFVVDAKGNIKDVQLAQGIHPILDNAAIELLKGMPKWTPGKLKGENVATRCIMPVNFRLM